jgi:hypothetical protein
MPCPNDVITGHSANARREASRYLEHATKSNGLDEVRVGACRECPVMIVGRCMVRHDEDFCVAERCLTARCSHETAFGARREIQVGHQKIDLRPHGRGQGGRAIGGFANLKAHGGETSAPRLAQARIGFGKENRSLLSHRVLDESRERWIGSTLESRLASSARRLRKGAANRRSPA